MAKLIRQKQIVREYSDNGQPSLSPQATPGNADFVSPFQSSNDILGYPEAAGSTRPADWVPAEEE